MNKITPKQIIFALLGFIVTNLIAGYGIVLMGANIPEIYASLMKPDFAPPTSVFGIVWTFNTILFIYGFLLTLNSKATKIRSTLLKIDYLIIFNYSIFQYISFGSGILFGKIIPAMFFIPTMTMFILTAFAMKYAYKLDTSEMSFGAKLKSGKSVFASFWPLFGWLIVASALGLGIWLMN
jgi:tryptophan-rich sensory protein